MVLQHDSKYYGHMFKCCFEPWYTRYTIFLSKILFYMPGMRVPVIAFTACSVNPFPQMFDAAQKACVRIMRTYDRTYG